ncbi:hypothetical protein [Ferruginibacter sp. HRS2-29]|uniref:hypothetical protein n=1 Tax=Ferruginibacter sp. HRS2-29 TaxID=2487334 RepID=UPI0020CE6847|nr:hypothetical protein [Ferruginibacter sp. HRS2-29]MCP9752797.1 hypothetical protein [Ferruginibacter sp. HRS2-29]
MKIFILLLSMCMIYHTSNAQLLLKKRTSKIEQMENFTCSYFIDLKANNSMRIDIYDMGGAPLKTNLDSLFNIIITTYRQMQDSLVDDLSARKLNISLYDTLMKVVSWSSIPPQEKRLLLYEGNSKPVKFCQDTVYLNVYSITPSSQGQPPFLRITLLLNDLDRIDSYNNGRYNAILKTMDRDNDHLWGYTQKGMLYLKADPEKQILKAYNPYKKQVILKFDFSLSAQNYKDRFVPSVHLGMGLAIEQYNMQVQYWIGSETHFTFSKEHNGVSKTMKNNFLIAGYRTINLTSPNKPFRIYPNFMLGYLVKRRDHIYNNHSFKLEVARISVNKGSLRIDPTFYFHDFFKGIIPSLRITQSLK